jgi:hypothetical protein
LILFLRRTIYEAGSQYFENACHGKHKFNFQLVNDILEDSFPMDFLEHGERENTVANRGSSHKIATAGTVQEVRHTNSTAHRLPQIDSVSCFSIQTLFGHMPNGDRQIGNTRHFQANLQSILTFENLFLA